MAQALPTTCWASMHLRPEPPRMAGMWTPLLGVAVAFAAMFSACTITRDRPAEGMHPLGFLDETSPDFHGIALQKAGYPLGDCRVCHGDDYQGGVVGVTCAGACHSNGVEACDTCHGKDGDPLPVSGAHEKHAMDCAGCHIVPEDARQKTHPNGNVEIQFSGLATKTEEATWSPTLDTCSSVYCHGGKNIEWKTPSPAGLGCDACHGAPPDSHSRWKTGKAPEGCQGCHPIPSAKSENLHVNGTLDLLPMSCTSCHGAGPEGMPPPSLSGDVDPSTAGVGAHVRHADTTLADRIGAAVPCKGCHPVPASFDSPGHLDTMAPADVVFALPGSYAPATQQCQNSCHWDKNPGPSWTDTSGAARACDGCHAFPLQTTRKGTAHPPATDLASCLNCHLFEPGRHVDGHVDFKP
jgi:predicted CxxxxCH...CXXCH cytochrome family protein